MSIYPSFCFLLSFLLHQTAVFETVFHMTSHSPSSVLQCKTFPFCFVGFLLLLINASTLSMNCGIYFLCYISLDLLLPPSFTSSLTFEHSPSSIFLCFSFFVSLSKTLSSFSHTFTCTSLISFFVFIFCIERAGH